MNNSDRERLEREAAVFKALGHASRLLIVRRLAVDSHNVSELTHLVGADVSTVSRHLSVLKQAGIVGSSKHGSAVNYSLRVPCVLEFLDCVDRVLASAGR